MKIFGYDYLIGDPAVRAKAATARMYAKCGLIAAAAMGASFVTGYLLGLTCFYWG